jgi:hypothetical protein
VDSEECRGGGVGDEEEQSPLTSLPDLQFNFVNVLSYGQKLKLEMELVYMYVELNE